VTWSNVIILFKRKKNKKFFAAEDGRHGIKEVRKTEPGKSPEIIIMYPEGIL
jgi:hypothetical protein